MSGAYERFVSTVALKAKLSWSDAERASRAVLETLAERLSSGEARDLAGQLPPELAPWLATTTPAEGFDVDEFIRRVAEREQVDLTAAEQHARAVFDALGRTVSRDELADMVAELPQNFAPLIAEAEGRFARLMPADEFWQRVADRAAIGADAARRATDAVLTTLAERISGGEVEDLISLLPVDLHPPLQRGDALSNGVARRLSLDDFLRLVAEREGVTVDEAREHARAVFATLRDAVGEQEFLDVSAQLPVEYTAVEAHP